MNKDAVKSLMEKMGWDKKQAEKFLLASDRREQNMDSAKYQLDKRSVKKDEKKGEEAEGYNSQQWLERQTLDADKALLEAMQAGKGWACELFYKLMNRLKDKTELELKLGYSADERIRLAREIASELREFDKEAAGGGEVPSEPLLLPKKIRSD